jgi:hypothetical protein
MFMPTNYPVSSSPKYLLYSHYKALDQVQDLGLIPLRLFRVLYPLWRVRVEGRQRISMEFDELEWYVERGLHEAGFSSVGELAAFFGLEQNLVQRLVNQAREIGHLTGDDEHLSLTELGLASVEARVRYQDQTISTELYFDALGNTPLSMEHFKIPILESLPDKTPFQAFYQFDHTWQEEALIRMLKSPEKQHFGLPDEITASQLLNHEPAYLPAYFIEVRENKSSSLPRLLVFSQVRGLHDTVLEEAVNRDPTVYRALKAKTDSRAESVRRYFERSGLKKDAWYLNENGPWGAQVMVDGQVFLPGSDMEAEESGRLSLRSVGRYALIYDWCIWVMCDDVNIRKQAAAEQLLEWLQGANATPSPVEINRKFAGLCQRLSIELLPAADVLALARQKGLARAAERLEELDEG